VNLLNNVKLDTTEKLTGKHNFTQWIIDIGTSHHMIGELGYLTNARNVLECLVGLLYGKKNFAAKERMVVLS